MQVDWEKARQLFLPPLVMVHWSLRRSAHCVSPLVASLNLEQYGKDFVLSSSSCLLCLSLQTICIKGCLPAAYYYSNEASKIQDSIGMNGMNRILAHLITSIETFMPRHGARRPRGLGREKREREREKNANERLSFVRRCAMASSQINRNPANLACFCCFIWYLLRSNDE